MNAAPAASDAYFADEPMVSDKNRLLALLLALLFGVFGAHRFYVGKIPSALAFILLDLTFIGFAVTGIWSMIDALFFAAGEFTDDNGDKLVNWQ
ncbi:MAG: NINE protein [Pirellulales bacterium]